jgi:CRP-like cAMP-binding protein
MDWALAEHFPRQHLPAGATLFHEGDFGASMYLVVEGQLQVSKRLIEGADKVLTTLGAGQYVGEMSLLTGAKRSATVQALVDAEVIEIDQPTFENLLHDQPRAGVDLMRQMARRLEETNEELILLALEVALAHRGPQRLQPGSRRMRFVATGSFASDKTAEVLRLAGAQAPLTKHPALVTSLLLPGRTHQALVYVFETDNPRDILELVAPFAGLVQWDIAPAIEVTEALPAADSPEADNPPPSFTR